MPLGDVLSLVDTQWAHHQRSTSGHPGGTGAYRVAPPQHRLHARHEFAHREGLREVVVCAELEPERALVGFCGGPFTVAGYLVEGRPSRDFARTKARMYSEPAVWHALMERLADHFARYVSATASAGADAIQLFDSWAGVLSVGDYTEHVAPYSARLLEAAGVPTIHFGTGTSERLLAAMARAGGDAVGVDWRIPLDAAWEAIGDDRAIQGNLDPAVLLGPWERVEAGALDVLGRAGGRPGHVFNLGHGVLPQTDPDVLTRLAALVRDYRPAG